MALLGATSLTGCNSIPSFISSGTKSIFNMATSPVSWTKDTTVIEGTLRVTNSTVSPGGSLPFSQTFASRPASVSIDNSFVTVAADTLPTVPITVPNTLATDIQFQPATISEPLMRAHTHNYQFHSTPGTRGPGAAARGAAGSPATTGSTGSGGSHDHTYSRLHTHQIPSVGSHGHPSVNIGFHTHPSNPVSVDFRINYVDMIICTKD